MIEAFGAVAPHCIQRVGKTEEQGAGAAEQGEPEQRAEDGIVAVFEHRFNAGLGDTGLIELRCFTGNNPADALPCFFQPAFAQGLGDGFGVLGQALRAEGKIEQHDIDDKGGEGAQHECKPGGGQYGNHPAENAGQPRSAVQPFFNDGDQVAEADQRVKTLRLAEPAVEQHRHQGRQRHRECSEIRRQIGATPTHRGKMPFS